MNSCISHDLTQKAPEVIAPFQRLLAVGETKRSGLILCKVHYAEFAGPGAVIGCPVEPTYSSVIAIGSPEIFEVVTHEQRQKAYSRRIQWVRWLHKIVAQPDPIQRAEKLFAGFEEFFGGEVLADIPDTVLALLAGVLPQTIASLRSHTPHLKAAGNFTWHLHPEQFHTHVNALDWRALQPSVSKPTPAARANPPEPMSTLPYSA
ncbi:MAG: hypothetical protein HC866_15725 [Leptolyngbyaceae cyanobacterium RU_5_1]|nr:hypothetical protein [Leptolyngbyaceae cyanobacterium RU_5_1]